MALGLVKGEGEGGRKRGNAFGNKRFLALTLCAGIFSITIEKAASEEEASPLPLCILSGPQLSLSANVGDYEALRSAAGVASAEANLREFSPYFDDEDEEYYAIGCHNLYVGGSDASELSEDDLPSCERRAATFREPRAIADDPRALPDDVDAHAFYLARSALHAAHRAISLKLFARINPTSANAILPPGGDMAALYLLAARVAVVAKRHNISLEEINHHPLNLENPSRGPRDSGGDGLVRRSRARFCGGGAPRDDAPRHGSRSSRAERAEGAAREAVEAIVRSHPPTWFPGPTRGLYAGLPPAAAMRLPTGIVAFTLVHAWDTRPLSPRWSSITSSEFALALAITAARALWTPEGVFLAPWVGVATGEEDANVAASDARGDDADRSRSRGDGDTDEFPRGWAVRISALRRAPPASQSGTRDGGGPHFAGAIAVARLSNLTDGISAYDHLFLTGSVPASARMWWHTAAPNLVPAFRGDATAVSVLRSLRCEKHLFHWRMETPLTPVQRSCWVLFSFAVSNPVSLASTVGVRVRNDTKTHGPVSLQVRRSVITAGFQCGEGRPSAEACESLFATLSSDELAAHAFARVAHPRFAGVVSAVGERIASAVRASAGDAEAARRTLRHAEDTVRGLRDQGRTEKDPGALRPLASADAAVVAPDGTVSALSRHRESDRIGDDGVGVDGGEGEGEREVVARVRPRHWASESVARVVLLEARMCSFVEREIAREFKAEPHPGTAIKGFEPGMPPSEPLILAKKVPVFSIAPVAES